MKYLNIIIIFLVTIYTALGQKKIVDMDDEYLISSSKKNADSTIENIDKMISLFSTLPLKTAEKEFNCYITSGKDLEELIIDLDLINPNVGSEFIKSRLEKIETTGKPGTNKFMLFFYLYNIFKGKIDEIENSEKKIVKISNHHFNLTEIYLDGWKQNNALVLQKLESLIENKYTYYAYREDSKKLLKGFEYYHENDFLLLPVLFKNKDRDYTGGFNFEFYTDFFKTDLFDKRKIHRDKILGYQSISLSGEGYTPDIRFDKFDFYNDLINHIDATTGLYDNYAVEKIRNGLLAREKFDRPYASTIYFSINKYRMPYDGYSRFKGSFKIGSIGSNSGADIQRILHRDLSSKSPYPYLWDRQISAGGRLSINYTFTKEIMLISQVSTIFNKKKYLFGNRNLNEKSILNSFNLYGLFGGALGSEIDALELGFGVTNKSFQLTGGKNELNKNATGLHCFAEFKTKFIYHNAILDGKGVLRSSYDDPSDSKKSAYVLYWNKADGNNLIINPIVSYLKIGVNKTIHKINVSVSNTYRIGREFHNISGDNSIPYSDRLHTFIYGYGNIKFNYFI